MPKLEPRDLCPGALEKMVLRRLQQEPLHGYALAQRIQRPSNDLLRVEEGSLYPALQHLLKAKLVRAEVFSFEQMLKGVSLVLALGDT